MTGVRSEVGVDGVAVVTLDRPEVRRLVLVCDLVVCSTDAFFSAPFSQRVLIGDAGLPWTLSRRLGHQRGAELLLLGERLQAGAAHEQGLVSRLVPPGEAQRSALERAWSLAAAPVDAVRLNKSLLSRAPALSLAAFLDEEHLHVALNGHSRDVAEGRRGASRQACALMALRARSASRDAAQEGPGCPPSRRHR